MKEFEFIHRFLSEVPIDRQVLLGIGDDAAVVMPTAQHGLCISSDMLVAGRHFFPDVAPEDLAYKILAVNLSDIAAMGARPKWVLLSAALSQLEEKWIEAFCKSLFATLAEYGATLIGGDTTRGPDVFNITILGEAVGKVLQRNHAEDGDDIWVSGRVGLAAAALHQHFGDICLPDEVFLACEQARLRPTPRVALGQELAKYNLANAAQDISDGLAQDLCHILTASQKHAILYADAIPSLPNLRQYLTDVDYYRYVLAGGDDYELLFTAKPESAKAIEDIAQKHQLPLTRIGKISAQSFDKVSREEDSENFVADLRIENAVGEPIILQTLGFDHFE